MNLENESGWGTARAYQAIVRVHKAELQATEKMTEALKDAAEAGLDSVDISRAQTLAQDQLRNMQGEPTPPPAKQT